MSEEEQHNAWNHLLELFTLQGSSPKIQQSLKEEELCKTALTCSFALDVIWFQAALGRLVPSARVDVHICCPGFLAARVFMKVLANLNVLGPLDVWTFLLAVLRALFRYGTW